MTDKVFLEDARVKCMSGIGAVPVGEYLDIIERAYADKGGIEGQRAPLKTKTGISIRRRMIDDIKNGAVLPPVVIGAVVDDKVFASASRCNTFDAFNEILRNIPPEKISIIDGMQRTTALKSALAPEENRSVAGHVRVDLWLAKNVNSLIYRMLVLNTGQVPWGLKRQLETIYKQIVEVLRAEIHDISIFTIDDTERRSDAGQYRASRLIELFLAFTSRKLHLDLKEQVAEDFARMDMTEATSNEQTLPAFIRVMKCMADLDAAFASAKGDDQDSDFKFKSGKDIFTSAPGSIGFSAAAAQFIFDMPGYEIDFSKVEGNISNLEAAVASVINRIKTSERPSDYLDLITLNQVVSARSGKIGEYEREVFFSAFEHMFSYYKKFDSLTPCWLAKK